MNQDEFLSAIADALRRHIDPESPMPMRMMAAKGMAPMPPNEMVVVACGLALDADEKIATAARRTLEKMPDKILGPVLEGDLQPVALAVIGPLLAERDAMLEKLVLNRATPDEAIVSVAAAAPPKVAEIIAGNQERCLRSEAIVRAIAENGQLLRSSLDRLFDFLVRSGVIYGEMSQFAEAMARLSPTEMQEAADKVELPPEVRAHLVTEETAQEGGEQERSEQAPLEEQEATHQSLNQLIGSLNVAQRVALAMRGSREARTLLVRDSNRVVAASAIRSPRVTEQEVIAAAQSRSVSDEVVRIIAGSKEMTRSYGVKLALVNNPKTPLPTAMRFLTLLRQNDLKAVGKSKNVTAALANQAKRLLQAKSGRR